MFIVDNFLSQRNFALAVLLVLITNLIIGGILLPHRQAQAVLATLPLQIAQWVEETIGDIWNKIETAYDAAASWISATYDEWQQADTWYQRALTAAWYILRKKMLDMLVDDIIKWIQGGGKPKAITNWQGFLGDVVNQAGGQFVSQYLGAGFLCQPFQARLQFALANPPPFNIQTTCTLSQIGTNLNNFLNNFSNGGWKGWLTINETQNNIYGAYLTALNQKLGVQADAAQAAQNEGIASSGFLGDKICTQIYATNDPSDTHDVQYTQDQIPDGYTCSSWQIRTPGKIAAEAMTQAADIDIPWLLSSQQFEAYAGAIIDAVINRAIKSGVLYMTTPSGGSSNPSNAGAGATTPATVTANISAYQDASQNVGPAQATVDQLNLLKQNLTDYASQLQTNLGILNQIRNGYLGPLNTLNQMMQLGCALPAGVTQTPAGTTQTSNCSLTCPCTATTTDNFNIASPVGSMTEQRITAQKNGEMTTDPSDPTIQVCSEPSPAILSPCLSTCSLSTAVTYNATNLPGTPIDGEINSVTSQLNTANAQIAGIDTAIANTTAYVQAANNYMTVYQQAQSNQATQAQLDAAAATMTAAKNQAIPSVQTTINSTATDFQSLLQQTQNASIQTVQNSNNAQMKRGSIPDCSYLEPGTYYTDLCNVQGIQNNYQSAYNNCAASPPPPSGGG